MSRPIDDDELLSMAVENINQSVGTYYTTLTESRAAAMESYFQEPMGNEVEGKSQVVTSEVADTVEWFMPSLMKVFTAGGEIAKFDPETAEDIRAAKQETQVINHLFFKKMDGFNVLHDWFKDALLLKNGIVKYYFDERKVETVEEYAGLTMQEFEQMAADPEMEAIEWEFEDGLIDVSFRRTRDESYPQVEVIPPEEFYIHPEYESLDLDEVPFVCHETLVSASDLIRMGYKESVVDELNTSSYDTDTYEERAARFADLDGGNTIDNEDLGDSMRDIQYAEVWMLVDLDGSGEAKRWKVCIANRATLLDKEEAPDVPFVSITPVPMPHRFYGRSIADQTMDIQDQKTTLLRNIMDNMYLINNQRTIVLEGGANIDDLLVSRAGGILREYTPGAIRPFETKQFTGQSYEMLGYFDEMKEARTGITKYNQGLDANSLNKTATGMGMIMDASQARIELVARLFANGVAKLFVGIHKLMLTNIDREMTVQISGDFVPVDPREWRDRTSMTVTVGLGTSDDEAMLARLTGLLGTQKELMSMGFVGPEQMHSTLTKMVEAMGLRTVDAFFIPPEKIQPPPPPPPDPQLMLAQGQIEVAREANQINRLSIEMKHKEAMAKIEVEMAKVREKASTDMRGDVFDLTKLEVDSGENIPGSVV